MNDNKVSIIVPIYNVEKYLCKCLDSILNQTYKKLEIILVDDGSPDNCGKICDEYAKKDSRIKVVHKENGGLSSARNAGLEIATGDIIAFIDSDDWVYNKMIEKTVNVMLEENADIVCFEFTSQIEDTNINNYECNNISKILNSEEAIRLLLEGEIKDYVWNKIFKKEVFENLLFPIGRNYEDMATTYLTFLKASKIVLIQDKLYFYYIRANSIVNVKDKNAILKGKYDAMLAYYERIENISKKFESLRDLSIKNFIERAIGFIEFIDLQNDEINNKYRKDTLFYIKEYYDEYEKSKYKKMIKLIKLKIILNTNLKYSKLVNKIKRKKI
jgi:glycosyltransferase involved in cell wall biosynthesis